MKLILGLLLLSQLAVADVVVKTNKTTTTVPGDFVSVTALSNVPKPPSNIAFGQVCPASSTCNYTGAWQSQPVKMSCASGVISVSSASYGLGMEQNFINLELLATSSRSCMPYVTSQCNKKASCTFSFTNDACGGDPLVGKDKMGWATISCAAAPPPPPPILPVPVADCPKKEGYTCTFHDEFNDGENLADAWNFRYIFGDGSVDTLNDEKQHYTDRGTHFIQGNELHLKAFLGSTGDADRPYESGMVRSKFAQRYGYWEARVKFPKWIGAWPAFWTGANQQYWPPEIDIFEFVNNGVEDTNTMLHSGAIYQTGQGPSEFTYIDPSFHTDWTYFRSLTDLTLEYHIIGFEWTETDFSLVIDGVKIYTRKYLWNKNDGTQADPAETIFNLAVGGQWAGRHGVFVDPEDHFKVDYIRIYQRNDRK